MAAPHNVHIISFIIKVGKKGPSCESDNVKIMVIFFGECDLLPFQIGNESLKQSVAKVGL